MDIWDAMLLLRDHNPSSIRVHWPIPFVLLRMCVLPIDSNLQGPILRLVCVGLCFPNPSTPICLWTEPYVHQSWKRIVSLIHWSHGPGRYIIVLWRANMTFSVSWKIVHAFVGFMRFWFPSKCLTGNISKNHCRQGKLSPTQRFIPFTSFPSR